MIESHVGQVGNLPPIGNRPGNYVENERRIANPRQVINLPHKDGCRNR